MFINVVYKDVPELSALRVSSEMDLAVEKSLLVNPKCPVRIILEYIRKKCKLGLFTNFDLCDESGALMGLFDMPTYEYATDKFQHKRNYYVIVIKQDKDKRLSVLPQLNHENQMYEELKMRVKRFMTTGEFSPMATPTNTSLSAKVSAAGSKLLRKKK